MNNKDKLKVIIKDIAVCMIDDLNDILEPVNFLSYIYDYHLRYEDELNMVYEYWDDDYYDETLGDIALDLNMDEGEVREELYNKINEILDIEID